MARAQAGSCRFFVRSRSFCRTSTGKSRLFASDVPGCAGISVRIIRRNPEPGTTHGRAVLPCPAGQGKRDAHEGSPAATTGCSRMRVDARPLQRRDVAECAWMLARCDDEMQPVVCKRERPDISEARERKKGRQSRILRTARRTCII